MPTVCHFVQLDWPHKSKVLQTLFPFYPTVWDELEWLDTQVETVVRSCTGCQMSRKSHPPDPIPPISIPKPTVPWKHLGLDISSPFATAPQNKPFIISIVDYYSSYPEVFLSTDIQSSAIVQWLKELFVHHGCPDEVAMDNGPQSTSSEFQQFLTEHRIWVLITSI